MTRRIFSFFLVGLTILIIACSNESEPEALPDHYCFELTFTCFCLPAGLNQIEVRNDEVISYSNEHGDIPSDQFIQTLTISQLSLEVEDYLSRTLFSKQVEYHPVYGFPSKVFFDVDQNIADEEWGYDITNFRAK